MLVKGRQVFLLIFQFWNNISNVLSFVENDFLLKGGSSFPEISLSGAYHREWMESLGNKINIEMGREKQGKEIMTIWLVTSSYVFSTRTLHLRLSTFCTGLIGL